LAVGLNFGLHEDNVALWRPTIEMLIEAGVPCLFTSYNVEEAEKEAAMFRSAGAHIKFGPEENVWRSFVPLPEPRKIDEFYYNNFWKVGFCGSIHHDL